VLAAAVKGLPLLIFVAVAIWLAQGRERRWLTQSLASEVSGDAISAVSSTFHPLRRRRPLGRFLHEMRGTWDLLFNLKRRSQICGSFPERSQATDIVRKSG